MKIIHKNLKTGEVKLRVENLDDLWYLSIIIEENDLVRAETERKIKIGDAETENARIVRKKMHLVLRVEKAEFSASTNALRILGTIEEGPDDIPHGAHHSFGIEVNDELKVEKEEWLSYQLEKLDESTESAPSILVVVFDREEALFGILKNRGFSILAHLKGEVAKKAVDEKKTGNFYKDISGKMEELVKRYNLTQVIAASAGFWKEYLAKELTSAIKGKVTFATCSDVSTQAINELLKRPELKTVLEKDRSAKEDQFVDKLLDAIARDKAAYGVKEVKEKATMGAISSLLVTDRFIRKTREAGTFQQIDAIMKAVDSSKGSIHILSTDGTVKKVDGLGGIAGVLRWT